MMFDKKKAAHMILSKKGKEAPIAAEGMFEGGPVGQDSEDHGEMHIAAQDMMSAIHNKSPLDLHKALHSYLELRKQLEPGEGPDNSPSDNEAGTEAGAQYKYND